jgi:rod shape-determining protein MreD
MAMRFLVYLLMGVAWLVVETVLMSFLPLGTPTPDVILVLVVAFGFRLPLARAGVLAFVLNLCQDVLTGGILGLNALSKTVIVAITKGVAERFYFPSIVSELLMVTAGAVVNMALVAAVLYMDGVVEAPFWQFFVSLVRTVMITTVTAPVVLVPMTLVIHRLEPESDVYEAETHDARTRRA